MHRMMVMWALACGVTSSAQTIRVDFDHKCQFSRYKTYSWVALPEAQLPNQLMQERIVGFVEESLAAKGLKRVEKGGDVLVGYQMKVTEQPQFTTFTDSLGPGWGNGFGWGWGSGWGWNSAISTTTTQSVVIGALVIDMMDSHQNRLVFQGVSTDFLSSRPEKNTKKFKKGIDKVFAKYPPRP